MHDFGCRLASCSTEYLSRFKKNYPEKEEQVNLIQV